MGEKGEVKRGVRSPYMEETREKIKITGHLTNKYIIFGYHKYCGIS